MRTPHGGDPAVCLTGAGSDVSGRTLGMGVRIAGGHYRPWNACMLAPWSVSALYTPEYVPSPDSTPQDSRIDQTRTSATHSTVIVVTAICQIASCHRPLLPSHPSLQSLLGTSISWHSDIHFADVNPGRNRHYGAFRYVNIGTSGEIR